MISLSTIPQAKPIPKQSDLRYSKCNGKKAITPRKDDPNAGYLLEELEGDEAVALILPDGITVLDFDSEDMVSKYLILENQHNIVTRKVKTDRGLHVYFKTPRQLPNKANVELVCGLIADIKSYHPNVVITRLNGVDRTVTSDIDLEHCQELPKFLYPRYAKDGETAFKDLGEGGRNSTLSEYAFKLILKGYEKQDVIDVLTFINNHILPEKLSDSELNTILRDSTFDKAEEVFGVRLKNIKVMEDGDDTNTFIKLGESLYNPDAPWFIWKETKDGEKKLESFQHHILAKEITNRYHIFSHGGSIYTYTDKGFYEAYHNRMTVKLEQEIAKYYPAIKSRMMDEILETIRRDAYVDAIPNPEPHILCVKNGRLNVLTGQLTPHTHLAYDTQQIPTVYDPLAHSDVLDHVFEKIFLEEGVYELFEEFLGSCLLKTLRYRGALYITGEGANGKSTLFKLIKGMLGSENVSSLDPKKMTSCSFELSELENKLVNLADDVGADTIGEDGIIKKLITGEPIVTRRIYGDPYTLITYATQIFTANKMPHNSDKSYGSKSRINILPLTAQFKPTDPDYDPHIEDKLLQPQVYSALLNKAVIGAQRLDRNGGYTKPKVVLDASVNYEIENSYALTWLVKEMMYEEDDLVGLSTSELYVDFRAWCDLNGIRRIPHSNTFAKDLYSYFTNLTSESYRMKLDNGKRVSVRKIVKKIETQ